MSTSLADLYRRIKYLSINQESLTKKEFQELVFYEAFFDVFCNEAFDSENTDLPEISLNSCPVAVAKKLAEKLGFRLVKDSYGEICLDLSSKTDA